ncbi:A disintegrin and metalloproteinase with thrombospondin motifs 13 [Engraulis encrasicolus]|uniref:A disintegrin and metalloproteinase with thrombospondin motifs 13 n=1 Tax=Engraulis encrasicolus TaxID=184585 RepID=UPI002FD78411
MATHTHTHTLSLLLTLAVSLALLGAAVLTRRPDPPQDTASPHSEEVKYALGSSTAGSGLQRQRRAAAAVVSDVSHLELLVVVGADVQQIHRQDTERYILTNLNIASELLRDATLGANFRVHLVRMIILTEPEPEIVMSSNISASLRSVCQWGQKINPANDSDPLHADLLLYVTRYDLVLPNGNKLVRGVTQLGGACSSQWSCVITEDTGFDLGITIAHEIGHSFGINHDGVGNSCSGGGFMMASDGGYNSIDLTWSQCSRTQLHAFYSAGKAGCVSDLPVIGGSALQDWKPGLYYGVDDQCRIAFGSQARACTFTSNDMEACRVLSCHVAPGDQSSCKRLLVPLLDGTECAPDQWCLKGRCVSPDSVGAAMVVHGAWSSWSPASLCSRTCGGGVTHRRRSCNNPRPAFGGRDCEGVDIEAELCNQQSCVSTQLDFMAQQCSQTDAQALHIPPGDPVHHTWLPAVDHATGDLQCRLMCVSADESFMVSRGLKFVDGTRCQPDQPTPPGTIATCLGGHCQEFGCDGVLHSGKVLDVCGVCGGDSSSCVITTNTYSGGNAGEYVTFLTLPVNATQVRIVNTKPVFTHMAVLQGDGYIVAGQGSISLNVTHPSPLEDDHVTFHLYLTPDLLPSTEEITLQGPLQHDTHIQVFRRYGKEYGEQTDPEISYQYYTPITTGGSRDVYSWTNTTGPCSVTCGTGVQQVEWLCVDVATGGRRDESLCGDDSRTQQQHTHCSMPACPPSWEVGEFGACSASCGGGEKVREVSCVQSLGGGQVIQVAPPLCPPDARPHTHTPCGTQPCPARWRVSEPGVCSAVCGPGVAQRNVTCVREQQGEELEAGPNDCPKPRPPDTLPCVVDVCPIGWEDMAKAHPEVLVQRSRPAHVYVWSPMVGQCSRSCGNGSQQVWYTCVDHQSRFGVSESHCEASSKPQPHTTTCNTHHCPPVWRYVEGVCSVSCGGGVARRVLYCSRPVGGAKREGEGGPEAEAEAEGEGEGEGEGEEMLSDTHCLAVPRPLDTVECNTQPCPAIWSIASVSPCSVTCGVGVSERRAVCVQYQKGRVLSVPEDRCSHAREPIRIVPCRLQPCTFTWDSRQWSKCSSPCGYGVQSRAVFCRGPAQPDPVSPLLCMTLPKPITIQTCYAGECGAPTHTHTHTRTEDTHTRTQDTHTPGKEEEEMRTTQMPLARRVVTSSRGDRQGEVTSSTAAPKHTPVTMATAAPTIPSQTSVCGQLLLQPSGTIDLRNVTQRRCRVAIGRPLDEVITVRFEASTLDCRAREYVAFYDRLILIRKCERLIGSELKSRTNVLLVRQGRVTPGNGILLTYTSSKNPKSSRTQECDVQLFAASGELENPTKRKNSGLSGDSGNSSPPDDNGAPSGSAEACRVFINAPPSMQIRIQALGMLNSTVAHTYVLVRDVDTLQTSVYSGHQLFLWSSVGSRAELEFHGDYTHQEGTFRAQYTFI